MTIKLWLISMLISALAPFLLKSGSSTNCEHRKEDDKPFDPQTYFNKSDAVHDKLSPPSE